MSQIINTNTKSLTAQRNLASSQKGLAETLERLSTDLESTVRKTMLLVWRFLSVSLLRSEE